jgi:hypothetical protein
VVETVSILERNGNVVLRRHAILDKTKRLCPARHTGDSQSKGETRRVHPDGGLADDPGGGRLAELGQIEVTFGTALVWVETNMTARAAEEKKVVVF